MTYGSKEIAALIETFPRLFKGKEPPLGIATGAGWDSILRQLFQRIDLD
jgi:hypothetical protein